MRSIKALSLLSLCFAAVLRAEDFKTVDGQEFKDATVARVEPDGLVLTTNAGIAKVYFNELPQDVRERFHYDPAKAAAYAADQNAQLETLQKQRDEARRKQAQEIEEQTRREKQQRADAEQARAQSQSGSQRAGDFETADPRQAVPEHTYQLLQDHTILIRTGYNPASIHLKRGERYRGRIYTDHAEIDIRGISYWVPARVLLPVSN